MAKGKFIVAFLSLFLFVSFSKELPNVISIPHGKNSLPCLVSSKGNLQSFATNDPYFSKNVTRKDHVKVRYMGGECSFAICPTLLFQIAPEFAEDLVSIFPHFLVPAHNKCLLSLRGPPIESVAFV